MIRTAIEREAEDFRRYAVRDSQLAQRARQVLNVTTGIVPRTASGIVGDAYYNVWLDETPEWLNLATTRILREPRVTTNLPQPTPEPVNVEQPPKVIPKPSVGEYSRLDGVFKFCGGATAYSGSALLLHGQKLTEELAKQILHDYMTKHGAFATPCIYFPDRVGGLWDQLFKYIPVGTVFEFGTSQYDYKFKRVDSLPVIKSWTSMNLIVTHLLMGVSRTETEANFKNRIQTAKSWGDPAPGANALDVNNEGMI